MSVRDRLICIPPIMTFAWTHSKRPSSTCTCKSLRNCSNTATLCELWCERFYAPWPRASWTRYFECRETSRSLRTIDSQNSGDVHDETRERRCEHVPHGVRGAVRHRTCWSSGKTSHHINVCLELRHEPSAQRLARSRVSAAPQIFRLVTSSGFQRHAPGGEARSYKSLLESWDCESLRWLLCIPLYVCGEHRVTALKAVHENGNRTRSRVIGSMRLW